MSSLRQFRFKKETLKNGSDPETPSGKLVPGRKRIRAPASDSSDNDDQGTAKKSASSAVVAGAAATTTTITNSNAGLSVGDKELRMRKLLTNEPEFDSTNAHEALAKNDWNVDRALKYLRERCPKKKPTTAAHSSGGSASTTSSSTSSSQRSPQKHSSSNGTKTSPSTGHHSHHSSKHPHSHHHQSSSTSSSSTGHHKHHSHGSSSSSHHHKSPSSSAKPPPKRRHSGSADEHSDGGGGGATADDGYRKSKKAVYDSDDDDSEDDRPKRQTYHMSGERQKVFDFINDSRPQEFLSIKSVSQKKIDALCAIRPFSNWRDLVLRLGAHKGMSCDLLNACQEYLTRRNNLTRIMAKCTRMVDRLERAVADGGGIVQQPSTLNKDFRLADYQLIGLNWFAVMHQEEMNGILADEMGLGKTIQVIAFLAWLKETKQARGTHLVVVPSSTLDNWAKELDKWCPALKVAMYYGSMDDRRMMRIGFAKGGLADVDVLLTTYHIVGSTPEERKMFRVTPIHYVVFDEAHMLKNMTTQRYANLIRINASRRLLLTGTPLQNNLLELMSLLCFVMPSMFASNTDDIKALFQKNAKIQDDAEVSTFEQSQIQQAKRIMRPFVLRRLKEVVLNSLPPKTDHTLKVPMTGAQSEYYQEVVQMHAALRNNPDELSSMTIMMEMRKMANHPLLLRHHYTDKALMCVAERLSTHPFYKKNTHVPYIFEELAIMSDFQVQQQLEKYDVKSMDIPDALILGSGKFRKLDELLPQLKRDGHRVLIFSQFTMMLDILERYLDIREHGFLRLDGQTAVTERQELIDQYMEDPDLFIFLLSTKAGGLGINLTAADTVIIHDIDFNPYNDKQAEDRCHRMGQKKPVTIYRMLSEGTIEESMRVVAQSKLDLEKEVTKSGEVAGGKDSAAKEQKCMMRIFTMALGIAGEKSDDSEKNGETSTKTALSSSSSSSSSSTTKPPQKMHSDDKRAIKATVGADDKN